MLYRNIPFNNSKLLSNILFDVYELSNNESSCIYSTAPNGIIGLSTILCGDSYLKNGNIWGRIPQSSIYGLINWPDIIKMSNNFREIAIGFKPFFFQLLTQEKMSDIVSNPNLPTSLLFNTRSVTELTDGLKNSKNDSEIIIAIDKFIAEHISEVSYDTRILRAMELIYSGNIYNVNSISEHLNLSTTGTRNLFQQGIGRSPKNISKIIRINNVLKNYDPNDALVLQDIAFNNGYFDQAHFIHDFKSLIGLTPKQYFKNKKLTFDFYNFKRWPGDIFAKK